MRKTLLLISFLLVLIGVRDASAAVIFVTAPGQKITTGEGCTLPEAIYSANRDHQTAVWGWLGENPILVDIPECVKGDGDDIIVLPTRAVFYFSEIIDDADNITGPAATPIITSNITIVGNGTRIERFGSKRFRLFSIYNGNLTLKSLHVKGFYARGGDGRSGGGGGLGAGGAVYLIGGSLLVQGSTFESNTAAGGNGGSGADGGGGGGIGGHGGAKAKAQNPGGGGGGARGNGGDGDGFDGAWGGGTLRGGSDLDGPGFACGGKGGPSSPTPTSGGEDGENAPCAGGGGGGGGRATALVLRSSGSGGNGSYGGGGGGGSYAEGNGGHGGFGGGGGSGWSFSGTGTDGGNGGFGAGGGSGAPGTLFGDGAGNGGTFGGRGGNGVRETEDPTGGGGGGGGAGLGGAIFSHLGFVHIENSTFTRNVAVRGDQGGVNARRGESAGGAIFSIGGGLTIRHSTISGNETTGSGAGVVVYRPTSAEALGSSITTTFVLENSIIAGNLPGTHECYVQRGASASGTGNLIGHTPLPGDVVDLSPCPGTISISDPQLGVLRNNGGLTPTMAIASSSPARHTADSSVALPRDQRGQERTLDAGPDIGAFELCLTGPPILQTPCIILAGLDIGDGQTRTLTMQVTPSGGGTTSPGVGPGSQALNSVVPIVATPNPGYRFVSWSANVTDPAASTTTVVMDTDKVVTATFEACSCAIDVTGAIALTYGGFTMNPFTGRFFQTVTLRNNSTGTITGPISLVLDQLSGNATLANATGTTLEIAPAGSPYVNAVVNLAPGQSVNVSLQFINPSRAAITYLARVLAGPGAR
jgi:hypothetical protein